MFINGYTLEDVSFIDVITKVTSEGYAMEYKLFCDKPQNTERLIIKFALDLNKNKQALKNAPAYIRYELCTDFDRAQSKYCNKCQYGYEELSSIDEIKFNYNWIKKIIISSMTEASMQIIGSTTIHTFIHK